MASDPAVLPPSDGVEELRGPRGAAKAAHSLVHWLLALPLVLPHEASHWAACRALGVGVRGFGYSFDTVFRAGPVAVPLPYSFFVLHEPIDDELRSRAISLAPAGFFGLALLPVHPYVAAYFIFIGLTVVSDLFSMFVADKETHYLREYRFLVGGPDQLQKSLADYR